MAGIMFGMGCRGKLLHAPQQQLKSLGLYNSAIDGIFGKGTARAVEEYQKNYMRIYSGKYGIITKYVWESLMEDVPYWPEFPNAFDRALQVTVAFEGSAYDMVTGDGDKQGISWGILQWNFGQGTIIPVLKDIPVEVLNHVASQRSDFDKAIVDISGLLEMNVENSLHFIRNNMVRGSTVLEPYKGFFEELGRNRMVMKVQDDHVQHYRDIAQEDCETFELKTSMGFAFAFDAAVQNGGIRNRVMTSLQPIICALNDEVVKVSTLAFLLCNSVNPKYMYDVASRKLMFAHLHGDVHGRKYNLQDWGLSYDESVSFS